MNYREESLKKHGEWKGKIETVCRVPVDSREALSLTYTPGVAEPCLAIQKNPELSFELTRRWNTVAVITDGTAILGLGDIGPEAGMPVMEGKCALFKAYGGVDAFPICLKTRPRRNSQDGRAYFGLVRRHKPRGYFRAALLRGGNAAKVRFGYPRISRRPARHGYRHDRRAHKCAQACGQKERGNKGRY